MEEILNIDHHTKLLLVKALNKYRTRPEVARATGLSERTIIRHIDRYGITKDIAGRYHSPENPEPCATKKLRLTLQLA